MIDDDQKIQLAFNVFLWTNYVTKHQFFRSSPVLTRFFKHILHSTLNTSIFHVNL